jgi:YVTN family beta-propeller protein
MKLQSAPEYLMTYGWAIVLIAVALGALYALGVFNPSFYVSQQCLLSSGLSCSIVTMGTNGMLTLNVYQSTGSQINITAASCNSNDTFANPQYYSGTGQISIQPGSNATLSVQCYSGSSPFSGPVGSIFPGYVFISYNQTFSGFPYIVSGKILAKPSYSGLATTTIFNGYALTTSSSPSAGGTVALSPSGGSYLSGCTVMITAIPNAGYAFSSWTGIGLSSYTGSSNPAQVNMNGAVTEIANFAILSYSFAASNGVGGTISCTAGGVSSSCSASYNYGTQITINAIPASGYAFTGWTGSGTGNYYTGTTNPYTVTVTGNTVETASFAPAYSLTMSAGVGGTVSPPSGNYPIGNVITISATPNSGYAFTGWTGSGTGSYNGMSNPSSVTINANIVETASFAPIYSLTMNAGSGGTVSPSSGNYAGGNTVPIAATPNSGYGLIGWVGSGTGSYTGNLLTNTITMNANIVETANFVQAYYVPITLTNYQSSNTPTGFQQMLNVPSSAYSSYINSGWSNVEFTMSSPLAYGGTPLRAWVESNAVNTATNTLVWVNLGTNTIGGAASGSNTITIYMNFLSSNVMTSNTAYTGEAPQISGTYAQYDNGAMVFNSVYYDFAGVSLPSGLQALAIGGAGPYYSISNGITINPASLKGEVIATTATVSPSVVEAYVPSFSGGSYIYGGVGYATVLGASGGGIWSVLNTAYSEYTNTNPLDNIVNSASGSAIAAVLSSSILPAPAPPMVVSLIWPSTGSEKLWVNYNGNSGTASNPSYGSAQAYVYDYGNNGASSITYDWLRTRVYPPNGIMPSASFGSVYSNFPLIYSFSANALPVTGGSVSCSGSGVASCSTATYPIGTQIAMTATPNSGSIFTGWTGSGIGSYTGAANTVNVVVNGNIVENANFVTLPLLVNTISISGSTPYYVAFSPSGASAYVADYGTGKLSIINVSTNTIINTITVGTEPLGIAVNPLSGNVYVANEGSATVSVIIPPTNAVANTIGVNTQAYGAAINPLSGNYVYVANYGTSTVSVIKTATNTVVNTINVGSNPEGDAISPSGAFVYTANHAGNSVSVINTATNAVINTITVGSSPLNLAVAPSGNYLYVPNGGSGTVNVINTATNAVVNTITVGTTPEGIAIIPSGNYVYVANSGSGTVNVINTATNAVVNTIAVGTAPSDVAINPLGTLAYVTNEGSSSVSVISLNSYGGTTSTSTSTTSTTVTTTILAASFNGVSSYIAPGSIASGSAGSMAVWIDPSGTYSQQMIFAGFDSGGTNINGRYVMGAYHSSTSVCSPIGQWWTDIANGATNQFVCSGQFYGSASFPPGTWTQLIITYNGANVVFYKNGVSVNSLAQTVSGAGSAEPFAIGSLGGYTGGGFYFNGLISDAQLYSNALTATQVQQLYSEGLGGSPLSSNLVAWWPLSGTANDLSGNGYNGVSYNVIYVSATNSLSVTPGANGAVSCAYAYNGFSAPCSGAYPYWAQITMNAIPNSGYAFTGWTGSGTGSYTGAANPVNVMINGNVIETASFIQVAYVPITLTNSQSSNTPTGFQQMLNIPSNSYSAYINSGWTNVEFTANAPIGTSGNVPLYAWAESNAVNTATNTVAWVNLGSSTIPANSGTLTIYMNFLAGNVMTSNTALTGEAPQLSTNYAQYDNGALVFPAFYDDFYGTALSSKWTSVIGASANIVSDPVNNGIVINTKTTSTGSGIYAYLSSSPAATFYPGNVIRAREADGSATYPGNLGFGDWQNTKNGVIKIACTTSKYGFGASASGTGAYGDCTTMDTNWHTLDLYWGPTSANAYVDGSLGYTMTADIPSTALPVDIGDMGNGGAVGNTGYTAVSWILVHAYPPSGVMPAVSFGGAVSPVPSYSLPITLTNSQSSATPTGFQQMLTLPSSSYSSYESSGLQNVEFTSGSSTGTPLYAWCESGCTSASSNTVWWVNLGSSTIPASGGTLTIYMDFMSGNTMTSTSSYTGEAPQLYGGSYAQASYGQYDNGAQAFPTLYQDFKGTSTPPGWAMSGSHITISNGITYSAGTDASSLTTNGVYGLSSSILDIYGETPTTAPSSSDAAEILGYSNTISTNAFIVGWQLDGNTGYEGDEVYTNTIGRLGGGDIPSYNGVFYVFSTYWPSNSGATFWLNYASQNSITYTTSSSQLPVGMALSVTYSGHSSGPFYWARIRAYPPNGVMPVASIGSIGTVPIMLTNSQSSATPGNFQQQLTINSLKYSSLINSGWSNVEFTTGPFATGTPLYAWVESNAINTATNTVVWVNLGSNNIAANGNSLTIYLDFMPSNVMTSNTALTGEAPQLSTNYAQYDNGNVVFPFYDNFVGNALSSRWTTVSSAASITSTVSNGLSITATASGSPNYAYISGPSFSPSNVLRVRAEDGSSTYPGNLGFGDYEGTTKSGAYKLAYTNNQYAFGTSVSGTATYGSGITMDTNWHLWDVYWTTSNAMFLVDGTLKYTSTTNVPSTAGAVNLGNLGTGGNSGSTISMSVTYALVHAYPPNGIMPTQSGP